MTSNERVRAWCRIRGISVRSLAKRTGFSRSKAGRIIGGNQAPSADEAELIASVLGLTMAQFYGEMPSEPAAVQE